MGQILQEVRETASSVAEASNNCTRTLADGLQELQKTASRLLGPPRRETAWMGHQLDSPTPLRHSSTSLSLAAELSGSSNDQAILTAVKALDVSMREEAADLKRSISSAAGANVAQPGLESVLAAIQCLESTMKEETSRLHDAIEVLKNRVPLEQNDGMGQNSTRNNIISLIFFIQRFTPSPITSEVSTSNIQSLPHANFPH